jgi:hypothetical protein
MKTKLTKAGNKLVISNLDMEWVYFNGVNDYDQYSLQFNLDEELLSDLNAMVLKLSHNRDRFTFDSKITASRKVAYNGNMNEVSFIDHNGVKQAQSSEPVDAIPSIKGTIIVSPYVYNVAGNKGIKLSLYGVKLLEPISSEDDAIDYEDVDAIFASLQAEESDYVPM